MTRDYLPSWLRSLMESFANASTKRNMTRHRRRNLELSETLHACERGYKILLERNRVLESALRAERLNKLGCNSFRVSQAGLEIKTLWVPYSEYAKLLEKQNTPS